MLCAGYVDQPNRPPVSVPCVAPVAHLVGPRATPAPLLANARSIDQASPPTSPPTTATAPRHRRWRRPHRDTMHVEVYISNI